MDSATSPQSQRNPDGTSAAIHLHRRIFIGPMPEKLISQTEAHVHRHHHRGIFLGRVRTQESESNSVSQIIKDHAFHHFVSEGGRAEDWGEAEERGRAEALLQRWKETEWGAIWHRRHRQCNEEPQEICANPWIGATFEVGRLLGVSVDAPVVAEQQSLSILPTEINHVPTGDRLYQYDSFLELPAGPRDTSLTPTAADADLLQPHEDGSNTIPRSQSGQPSTLQVTHSQATSSSRLKGKGKKQVHYHEEVQEFAASGAASPTEVLCRTSATVEATTSAAASVQSSLSNPLRGLAWGDVILRDRMLVRVCTTKAECLGVHFHESVHRTTRDLQHQDWAEFVVAWRQDFIEIYEDYSTSLQEWAVGHKHLTYLIPLKSPRTHLSLYSFVDMTFCITCRPFRPYLKSKLSRNEPEGTRVYIFKTRSRSRAYDWTWKLWRALGGEIPQSIDIRNPRLGLRVVFELPCFDFIDHGTALRMLNRRNIIALCMKSLKSVPGWSDFVEHERQKGRTLQLAWRSGVHVDWIWNDFNAEGEHREWSALCGLAFKNSPQAPVLELRVAEHYPTFLHLKNGMPLVQPPAIEGYVEHIRPGTQAKQLLYLVSHCGNLFTLSPHRAQPPSPPGCALMSSSLEEYKQTTKKVEIKRGIYHLMHARGVCDLRSIVMVQRAFQLVPQRHHNQKDDRLAEESWFHDSSRVDERMDSDDEDEGGDESLNRSDHKPYLRMKRSFELLLNTGRVVRFEVFSRHVASEWVKRLQSLVVYWKQRYRVNAKNETDLAQTQRPRVTPQIRVCDEHEVPPEHQDLSTPYPALDVLFNWCIIDGCQPIVKEGRLYMRKGLRGQYQLVQFFLVDGHLISFRISPPKSLHLVNKNKVNLIDAYVISGYLAALTLPKGEFRPNAPSMPRRYEDGLEADDRDEDMLFVICYRKHAAAIPPRPSMNSAVNHNTEEPFSIPPLSEKHKYLVCRARSKLERDGWCWALNMEIEKLTRKQKEREEKLRQTGNLRKLN